MLTNWNATYFGQVDTVPFFGEGCHSTCTKVRVLWHAAFTLPTNAALGSQIPDLNWKPSVYKTDALPIVLIWQNRDLARRFSGSATVLRRSTGTSVGSLSNVAHLSASAMARCRRWAAVCLQRKLSFKFWSVPIRRAPSC